MTFVTITDHNTINGVLEIAYFPDVFISCEYTVSFPEGGCIHILVYGLTERDHEYLLKLRENVYNFVKYLKTKEIAHSLAHPLYPVDGTIVDKNFVEKLILLFDNWEIINGARGDKVVHIEKFIAREYEGWEKIYFLAEKHKIEPQRIRDKISFTVGTDDHGGLDVGRTWTGVEGANDKEEFLRGIWEGRTLVGSEELGEHRLLNMISRVGYDYLKNKDKIPSDIKLITDQIFTQSENPTITFLLKNFLGIKVERPYLIKEILRSLPCLSLERLFRNPSPQTFGELCLALIAHSLPAFLKYVQRKEEERVVNLGKSLGYSKIKVPKVAYVTDTYHHINGVARSVKTIRQIAVDEDLPFTLLISTSAPTREENLINIKPIVEIPAPFYEEFKMGVPNFLDLLDTLDRNGFTQVHIATPGPMGLLAMLAGKILGLRITFAYHTDVPTYAKIYTGNPDTYDLLWKFFVFLANASDRLFVPSEYYKNLFINRGVRAEKVSLFKRGVDTEIFSPNKREMDFWAKRLGIRKNQKVILYVGRVSKEKGLDTFLYVAKYFPDYTFVIVGDGPYRPYVEANKPQNVYLVGAMVGEELAKAYASSYIFLFPSETETYGLVVLEAMASGLPVIVSSEGAANEHIEDGIQGLIATSKEDYVDKLFMLLKNECLYKSMSKEALNKAKSLDMRETYLDYMLAIAGLGRPMYEVSRYNTLLSW